MSDTSLESRTAAIVFLLSFALYVATLAPGTFWLDSSEFAAAGFGLGIPHPPGHPLYIMLAKGATLVPLGSVAFRINLLSAICGAIACATSAALALRIASSFTRTGPIAATLCGASGLVLAGSGALWLQSVRAEVYSPHLALVMVATYLAVRWALADSAPWRGPAPLAVSAALLGLALANHHYLVFLLLPALLLLVAMEPRGRRLLGSRWVLAIALPGLAGLLTYAYLPVRAAGDPLVNWGAPTTLSRFVDVVTARTFQASVTETGDNDIVMNVLDEVFLLMSQLHPFIVVLAFGGFSMLLTRWSRRLAAFFALALAGNLMSQALMRFDPANPDAHGYLQLSHALVTVLAALLAVYVVAGLRAAGRSRWVHGGLVAGLLLSCLAALGHQLETHRARSDLSRFEATDAVEDAVLAQAPPGSLLLASYYSLLFQHWYAQQVDGRRPDTTVVQQSFDAKMEGGVPYTEALRRRHPEWTPLFDAYLRDGLFPAREVAEAAASEPILLEPELSPPLPPEALVGRGLVFRVAVRGQVPPRLTPPELLGVWSDLYSRMAGRGDDAKETEAALLWQHFRAATVYLRQGDGLSARIEASFAADIDDASPAVHRLEELVTKLVQAPPAAKAELARRLRGADMTRLIGP